MRGLTLDAPKQVLALTAPLPVPQTMLERPPSVHVQQMGEHSSPSMAALVAQPNMWCMVAHAVWMLRGHVSLQMGCAGAPSANLDP